MAFVELPLQMKAHVEDVLPMDLLCTEVSVKKWPIDSSLKVSFNLKSLDEDNTEVLCEVTELRSGMVIRRLLRGQQKKFARKMLDAIRGKLQFLLEPR
ncbi:MAG: hypothetical protein HY667_01680 [Chloroflexi bacterium]|nr:hypothetical protein [Chloroflexota bacterium]